MSPEQIKKLQEKASKLEIENTTLKREKAYLAEVLRKEAGPLRSYREDCPQLEVGRYVIGNKQVFGRVTWIGYGGGVWAGQELCEVDGHGLIATNQVRVL